jgi:flavin-dependent dehydrogenase
MRQSENGRVVVIGAGIGGLTAASLLRKAGLDPCESVPKISFSDGLLVSAKGELGYT